MRCFIAIELDNDTKLLLINTQKLLSSEGIKWRFTAEENLHLTLHFLGEIDNSIYQRICMVLYNVAQNHKSFELTLNRIGKFKKRTKNIIWTGISNSSNLLDLRKHIEDELKAFIPLDIDAGFTPHITLARDAIMPVREVTSPQINHSFMVSGISLMESTRVNGTLKYIQRVYENFLN